MSEIKGNGKYGARWTELDNQFTNWLSLFKDVKDYILPRRGFFLDRQGKPNEKVKFSDKIIDGTATRANRTLGAGMQGGLASPSRPWFRLTLEDSDRADFGPNKDWLQLAEDKMYKTFAGSNFYNEIHMGFEEQGGFGTAPLMQEEDIDTIVRFRLFTAGEYRLACDARGIVDTIYRRFWMQALPMVRMFGEANVSVNVKNTAKSKPYEWFQVLHVIQPREQRDPNKIDNLNMPWESMWMEVGAAVGKFLRQSGYAEFPVATGRWSVVGETPYGLSPGHDILGDAKMLQELSKGFIKAVHKMVDPSMKVPSKFKDVLNLLPGATNYVDVGKGDAVGPLYEVNVDLQHLMAAIQDTRGQIQQGYYSDLFLMMTSQDQAQPISATEVLERHEEKLLMLGPTIERQIHYVLDPTITRNFNIHMRNGLFPPPPEDLAGQPIKIEFISVLAQAQKIVAAQSINTHLSMVERVAGLDPDSALASTDFLELLNTHADIVGVPANIPRTKEEAEAILAAILQQKQQQAQNEQAALAMENLQKMGNSSTEPGTALGDLQESLQ